MNIQLTDVNSAGKIKAGILQGKRLAFGLLCTFLFLGLFISTAAAATEWKITPSNPTVGDTLKIKGTASPNENLRAEVSFEKELPVSGDKYQYLLEDIKVPSGDGNRFSVTASGIQNLHVGIHKLIWFNFNSEASGGVATISQGHVPPLTYTILIDGDALSGKSSVYLTVTASQMLTADSKGKFEFSYDTSSMPAGKYNIKIGNSVKSIALLPKGHK